ncbi:chromatin-binding transcription coactivator SUB1 PWA37_005083 [Arxiozyma heterogenica]|uniref:chromatin-binding transcription coactivator SUB1 n=1 Tax=Arxiozyma heterogenica TaxID=278026 RepID=UPI002F2300EB
MSYYNRYRNRRRQDGANNNNTAGGSGGGSLIGGSSVGNVFLNRNHNGNDLMNNGGLQVPDAIFDLGKNKRVTVRQFRNINLIDIREYYQDSQTGELRPGKKGISLTEDLYDALLKHRLNIDEALRRFGSRRPRTKLVRLLSDDEYDSSDSDRNTKEDNKDKNKDKDKDKDKNKNKNRDGDIIIGYDNDDDGDNTDNKDKKDNNNNNNSNSNSNNNKDSNKDRKDNGNSKGKDGGKERLKESSSNKRERDYSDSEITEQKKRKPAAATLLPYEESIENAKREANATLIIPGMGKQKDEQKDEQKDADTTEIKNEYGDKSETKTTADTEEKAEPVPKLAATDKKDSTGKSDDNNNNNDSSAEEFAESLQAEMDKMMDESSEEE